MPYRRSYRRRRATRPVSRLRRYTARRRTVRFRRTPLQKYRINNIHQYKRSVQLVLGGSTGTLTGTYFRAFVFRLNDLPNYLEFTSLYDYYKIRSVALTIMWRSTNLSMIETQNSIAKVGLPIMYYVIDRDDDTAPTAIDQLREYSRAKRFEFDTGKRACRIYLKCNTIQESAETAGAAGKQLMFNKWNDCNNSDIYHYGLKIGIYVPMLTTGEQSPANFFDVEATYYLSFKDPR